MTLSDVFLAYTSYFVLLHIKTNAELHSESKGNYRWNDAMNDGLAVV